MPALIETEYTARVVWLGQVADRESSLIATPVDELQLGFAGPKGEAHSGLTRPSCARVTSQYDLGTEIRNTRQLSIISAEELTQIANNMGVVKVDPAWLGASIVLQGIPDLTHIPPSSRLQVPGAATLTVDMENRPCQLPARVIEQVLPGFGKTFKAASKGLRGVTAWVEQVGTIRLDDRVKLHIPDQPQWSENAKARGAK